MNSLQTFEECLEEAVRMVHGDFESSHALLRCATYCSGVLHGFYLCGAVGESEYAQARDQLWDITDRRTERLIDWQKLDETMRAAFQQQGTSGND